MDAMRLPGPGRVLAALLLSAAVVAAWIPAAPAAPGETSADRVTVTATSPAAGEVRVAVAVAEHWHIYGAGDSFDQDTKVAITAGVEGLVIGPFVPDRPPTPRKYEFVDGDRMEYEGTVTWTAKVALDEGAAAGPRRLSGSVAVNACDAESCLAPGTVAFEVTVEPLPAGTPVAPAAAPPGPPTPPAPPAAAPPAAGSEGPVAKEAGKGLGAARALAGDRAGFLIAAMLAGLFTILTPCVFPMLPLTVSMLTKASTVDGQVASRRRIWSNATAYAAGMFLSLVVIGLAMSLVFKVGPSQLALSPGFNLFIFAFFVFLALSLLGAYDIQMPAFLREWAQGRAGTRGGLGLFFMGVTLALTSFSCAAPFAGALVVEARTDLVKGVLGMSVYAFTFTVPFFLLALFPGVLDAVKVVMGFVELAVAFKFLRTADVALGWDLFSYPLVLAIWAACCAGAALYLLGKIVLPHDEPGERIGVGRLLGALLFLALAMLFAAGVAGRRMPIVVESFLIPDGAGGPAGAVETGGGSGGGGGEPAGGHAELAWIENDLARGLAEAKAQGKPVFLDFTGVG
jgi:thiol:disulfide interchange protein